MGIDKEKLFLQLSKLEEGVIKLKDLKKRYYEKNSKNRDILIPAMERYFQITIESCINIGNHIISGLSFKRADTYKEVFLILYNENIISKELLDQMVNFVKFRNKLVHLYWEINETEILSNLEKIEIFKNFAEQIYNYLKKRGFI